ncbi:probable E3 ubiquitin-protein ligase RHG1A [Cryptomeria japonica]|uniref:probable E3 ubiquitin-protein ligase RHG1A n=1 Tax=Cryptomeria japonica TaxID=3369 RepID=UPI0025AD9244|nr:probable E3 ubiquitin-protein ligase RHG1A [Cryptomeria japonica]XP_057850245.1 probable E3 ubiquitin-protein ligase RHG1A [Cryptomeria japonica]
MQGQRNTIQPIPENFDLANMSDQNNMNIDSHIYQDDRINIMAAPNVPDYQVSGNGSNCSFRNMGSHTSSGSFVNRWASGSASDSENAAGQSCTVEDKMSIGWNPVSNMQPTSMVDGRQLLDTNILSSENGTMNILNNSLMDDCLHLRPSCSYGPTSDANSFNFIANQTPVGSYMDPSSFPHSTVLVGPDPEQMTFAGNSGVACLAESSNGRTNRIMEGRRVFCKRKTENISGPSLDPNPSSQWDEANLRFTIPGRPNMANGLSISVPVATATLPVPDERPVEEPAITRPGAGLNDVTSDYRCGFSMAGQPDGTQRNVRLRFSSHHPEANFPQIWPVGNAGRALPELQPHSSHSRHVLSGTLSADTGSAAAGSVGPLRQPNMFRSSSSIPRSLHSLGRNDNSSLPRAGNPMSGPVREPSSSMQEETSSRNMRMGNTNNAWLSAGTETRPANHDSGSWPPISRNTNEPRNHASMIHPAPVMPWDPQHVPLTQALRRSAGGVQGSGSSSISRSSQSGHIHPSRTVNFSSSSDNLLPRAGSQGQQYIRPAILMDRQGDGILGVPFGSLQALTAEGDGRNRLMSEIRNVLELMRRGETLRFEDILILDQSAFYNAADIHDQHRDMRLDVDNMTYEELLALEERIGNVSTGLTEETICKSLKKILYISGTESIAVESSKKQPEDELCSICREEYMDKDELGIIDCGHIHHSHCIKKWLLMKNLCPICKKTALNT